VWTAAAIGFVAVALTALSLSHLAGGVKLVTHSADWQAWAMAVGIDLGFVCTELSQIVIHERLRRRLAVYSRLVIFGTLGGSAATNAFAFAADAAGWMLWPAIALGLVIPVLIYALTRIGAAIYIDVHARG
jgi:hypothetical protein